MATSSTTVQIKTSDGEMRAFWLARQPTVSIRPCW